MSIVFCTLGPEGTCHDNAVKNYINFQKINEASIIYVSNFSDAVDLLKSGKANYIVQNCAHPQVGELNEKYCREIFIIDSFIFPTKPMGVIRRKDMRDSKTLGLMPATKNYVDISMWDELKYETSNPIVAEKLVKGEYGYGITFIEYVKRYPDLLEVYQDFGGAVDTVWIVYGKNRRNTDGTVIGLNNHDFYMMEVGR